MAWKEHRLQQDICEVKRLDAEALTAYLLQRQINVMENQKVSPHNPKMSSYKSGISKNDE